MRPRPVWILTPVIALAAVLPAAAQDVERLAMAAVRLSTDAAVARSCTRMDTYRTTTSRTCGGRWCGWAATPRCCRSAPTTSA